MPTLKSSPIALRRIVYLVVSFCSTVALAQAEEPSPEAKVERPDRNQRLVHKVWWNQPVKVDQLTLTADQRSQMDELLTNFLEAREAAVERQKAAFEVFGSALAAGDSMRAEKAGESVKEAMAAPLGLQVDMMMNVVDLLNDEQRLKLDTLYPRLLSHMWIRSANPRSGMMGARGKSLGRRKAVN